MLVVRQDHHERKGASTRGLPGLMSRMTEDRGARAGALSDLAFHILLALGEGPSHGYAIGKDVQQRSSGRLDPTTGALYQALRRLADDGLIAAADGPGDADARRKYFALTRQGRRSAAHEAARLDALVRTARQRKLYPQRA
jgi:DNA-binding PadR family transcriptional regulator